MDKMKSKFIWFMVLATAFIFLPLVSAVTITDTTFFANQTNFTIFVDFITLDQVIVTNTSIQFHNLTSVGSNFINVNATFDARADFIGLAVGLIIRNVNTETDLFESEVGDQDFNATFTPSQVLMIVEEATFKCNLAERSTLNLVVLFFALGILAFTLLLFFSKGEKLFESTPTTKIIIIVFIGILLGVIFIQVIADQVINVCN